MNAPGNMVVFRNSKKGYDKDDVNNYIAEMNIRFRDAEMSLKARIRELENSVSQTESRECSDKLAQLEAQVKELREENERLLAEREALSSCSLSADSSVQNASEADAPSVTGGSENYGEMSKRLGEIIIRANVEAEKLISDAELEAEKSRTDAEKNAEDIKFNAAVASRLMIVKVKEGLEKIAHSYIAGLISISEDTVTEYNEAVIELREKAENLKLK